MKNNTKTIKAYFKQVRLLHFCFLAFLFFSILIIFFIRYFDLLEPNKEASLVFQIIALVFFIITIPSAYIIFNKRKKTLKEEYNFSNKLEKYKYFFSFKLSMITGVGLFVIIAYLITNDILLFILSAIVLVILLLNWSSKNKIIKELNLTFEQQQILNTKDYLLTPNIKKSFTQKHPWVLIIIIIFWICLIISEIKRLI